MLAVVLFALLSSGVIFAQDTATTVIQVPASGYLWLLVLVHFIGFGVWAGKISTKVNKIDTVVEKIVEKLDAIADRVSMLEGIYEGKALAKEQSPLTLTEVGRTLLHDSGGKKYIEDNKESLLQEFRDVDNAFDIQERAKDVMREKIRETNGLADIKTYLFTNGKSVEDIVLVVGLELRDVVFAHKGITVEQVEE